LGRLGREGLGGGKASPLKETVKACRERKRKEKGKKMKKIIDGVLDNMGGGGDVIMNSNL
jgi:hypothetical protein